MFQLLYFDVSVLLDAGFSNIFLPFCGLPLGSYFECSAIPFVCFFFFFVYANGVLPEIIYQANVLDSTSNVPQYFLLGIFQFQVLHVNLSSTLMVIFITIILSHEVR